MSIFDRWFGNGSKNLRRQIFELDALMNESTQTVHIETFETPTDNVALSKAHFLLHVTSLANANNIIEKGKIFGELPQHATFAVSLKQCTRQARDHGCALVFDWNGLKRVGNNYASLKVDEAYHYLDVGGYIETFIKHGSKTPLSLIGIATNDDGYSTVKMFTTPVSILVSNN
jgi:hypothetical protein